MVTPLPALASVDVDLAHGGRWTSLRLGGREWLWHRQEPRRARVTPGSPFADAGGIEECVPTIRGRPDHGDAWSRSWRAGDDGSATVSCPDFTLRRHIMTVDGRVTARYQLSAEPGYRFVWAAHALLDVSARATLHVRGDPEVRLYPEAAAFAGRPWPPGEPFISARWPGPDGLRLDVLGPDDGTAIGAVVTGCDCVIVRDAGHRLRLSLHADAGLPRSVALWRNLFGFPDGDPYRSIGVEPMLGAVFDLAEARLERDAVTVPQTGYVGWKLEVTT